MRLIAENHFVTVYSVVLPPGTVGVDIKFRNESKEPARIEVAAVRGSVAELGVVGGDVMVAFGGYALPSRASALELEELMTEQETLGETIAVEVVMWRNKYRFRGTIEDRLDGEEILVPLTKHERAIDVLWAPIELDEFLGEETKSARNFYAVARGPPSKRGELHGRAFEQGIILVGINHEPVPDVVALPDLARRLEQHETTGPVLLNCWRVTSKKIRSVIVKRCQAVAAAEPGSGKAARWTSSPCDSQDCCDCPPKSKCAPADVCWSWCMRSGSAASEQPTAQAA